MKRILLLICFSIQLFAAKAEEGMLIPSLIAAFEDDMKAMGMKLSAEDLYSINKASIKDAIIHFGGGCTAEIVSKKGLLLTNHHCGYSQIQSHSSLKNDYLKNGFWAKNFSEELPNDGLTAARIVRIEDLTNQVLEGTEGVADLNQRMAIIQKNIKALQLSIVAGTHYTADIKAFDYGNSYYALVKETFLDVRLVGTPPNSIGKFGGDTDNWVWPRHTGDFSVFRIYAGKDNKPAPYSKDNVPYTPLYSLSIAAGDRTENEFTMVYGFPGQTEQHLISSQIQYIMDKERPARVAMREKSLSVIDAGMRSFDEIRIQYSSKQASIANAYKKWIGQVDGLQRLDAVNVKIASEKEFNDKANSKPEWKAKYGTLVADMNRLINENNAYDFGYAMTVEYVFVGPEFYKQVRNVSDLVANYETYKKSNELEAKIENFKKSAEGFFKNYNATIDQGIFNLLHEEFVQRMDPSLVSSAVTAKNTAAWSKLIFTKSIFTNKDKLLAFYDGFKEKSIKSVQKDPAYMLNAELMNSYEEKIKPNLRKLFIGMDDYIKVYIEGKQTMFPDKKHWPDANSTLRITYGKLEGSAPRDGMTYTNHTTTDGIIEKNRSGNPDFDLLPGMIELFQKKDFGQYAQDGELWVCFSGSNHTTGGNSGSPVLNAKGHLMGLNFDRSWESTMSDYMFDATRCRNIAVDIRYVLWVIDKYAGAKHLVDEMELVR
ncbi:MAG: S46 family peptidase [Crocinitomicaceae bacterium]|nr:S46 family peptidase [Crocinitomicaceae bacterium]